MSNRRSALLPGLFLILLGAWLLAANLNVPLPSLEMAWPVLPLGGGLLFIAQYFLGGRKDTGLIFVGVAAVLVGTFFFGFTLRYFQWEEMGRYWPVFVLIGSAAFFAQWLVSRSETGLLVPAILAFIVGVVALPLTLRWVNPALADLVIKFWPAALIVLGLALLARLLFRRA